MGLERFLHRLVAQPKLASDKIVLEFLTEETGWDEKVEATDYLKKSGKISITVMIMVFGGFSRVVMWYFMWYFGIWQFMSLHEPSSVAP